MPAAPPSLTAAQRARRRLEVAAALTVLRDEQCGVVSQAQAQVLACGAGAADLRRLIRRHELVRVHPRVYVDHTGELTWVQRAWAALLWAGPAALCDESAVRVSEGPGRRASRITDGPIHVAVARDRRLGAQDGVVVHRTSNYAERVQPNRAPARIRYDEAILDLASAARTDNDAFARLADACGARRTTGARLLVLRRRGRGYSVVSSSPPSSATSPPAPARRSSRLSWTGSFARTLVRSTFQSQPELRRFRLARRGLLRRPWGSHLRTRRSRLVPGRRLRA